MKAEHLRLGWCLVAPTPADDLAPSATQGLWSVAADLNGVQPGSEEWDQWYLDLNAARQACAASPVPGTVVVELAVDARDAARLLHEAPHANGWRLDLLREQIPSPSTSGILGHEPVGGQDYLLEHSWHCFSYPDELTAPPHTVTVNERGLLASHAVSERVVTHCQADRRLHGELWVGLRLCLV
ncbi:hypothetical protein [Luteococcus sp. OSA5]|uniref:hypothetical protein n=1 Tax=Luteococcus sp. OSA5 TaxID=3401630 RepID=UPI003B42F775